MTQNIATDRSQSQRLLDCGVDPKTADMTWVSVKSPNLRGKTDVLMAEPLRKFDDPPTIPAWSLSALLALLPKEIEDKEYGFIWCEIVWLHEDKDIATVRYYTPPSEDKDEYDSWEHSADPIEACVCAIEWLSANGYKLNEI